MQFRDLNVFLLLAFTSVVAQEAKEQCGRVQARVRNGRMINGDETSPHQYPWMVSVMSLGVHNCGGVLISPFYVLSAAHCFFGDPFKSKVTVVLGAHVPTGGVLVNGTVLVHNQYIDGKEHHTEHDMALIRLHTAALLSERIQPICLPRADDRVALDDQMIAIGWGMEIPPWKIETCEQLIETLLNNNTLKKLSFRAENTTKCVREILAYEEAILAACRQEKYTELKTFCDELFLTEILKNSMKFNLDSLNRMICAVHRPELRRKTQRNDTMRTSCSGDSGGPLMKQRKDGSWVVVGIISMGTDTCLVFLESHSQTGILFTDVLGKSDWIHSSMQWFDRVFSGSPSQYTRQIGLLSLAVISALSFILQ